MNQCHCHTTLVRTGWWKRLHILRNLIKKVGTGFIDAFPAWKNLERQGRPSPNMAFFSRWIHLKLPELSDKFLVKEPDKKNKVDKVVFSRVLLYSGFFLIIFLLCMSMYAFLFLNGEFFVHFVCFCHLHGCCMHLHATSCRQIQTDTHPHLFVCTNLLYL